MNDSPTAYLYLLIDRTTMTVRSVVVEQFHRPSGSVLGDDHVLLLSRSGASLRHALELLRSDCLFRYPGAVKTIDAYMNEHAR